MSIIDELQQQVVELRRQQDMIEEMIQEIHKRIDEENERTGSIDN